MMATCSSIPEPKSAHVPGDMDRGGHPGKVPGLVRSRAQGHTMVELLVVVVIVLSVTALALPSLTGLVITSKLRGGMGDLAGLYQNCRSQAVKKNRFRYVHFQTVGSQLVAFIDDADPTQATGLTTQAPQLRLPSPFSKVDPPSGGAGTPTALDNATCGASDSISIETSSDTYFNQLGIPCRYNSASDCANRSFAYYFNYAGALGGTNWAAICISPAGRIRSWYWNGSAWSN